MTSAAIINGREITSRIKLRVLGNERVRPLDHGRNVASGAVVARAQFKILQSVVIAPTIAVMNRFFGGQRAAKGFLHDESMLKDFASFDPVLVGKSKAYVALARYAFLHLPHFGGAQSFVLREFERLAAFAAAKRVAMVARATSVPDWGNGLAALGAGSSDRQALGLSHAGPRAIQGVLSEGLSVLAQFAGHPAKRLGAVGAIKLHGLDAAGPSRDGQTSVIAIAAAKFTHLRTLCREYLLAMGTDFFHQHSALRNETVRCYQDSDCVERQAAIMIGVS